MANAIVHWRTPSGQYRNVSSPDKTILLSLKAQCDVNSAGEGGIDYVEFYVSVNGGAATTHTVSARTVEAQNYECTAYNGRHLTSAFHHSLDLTGLAGGKVEVTASVFSVLGTETAAPGSIIIRNDTDGVDRRPSTKVIYCSSVSGTSGGAGTIGDPTDTLYRAIRLACNTPGGSTSTELDCGGAVIYLVDATTGFGGQYGATSFHTTDGWTLKIKCIGTDKTVQRTTPSVFTDPQDYVTGGGFGGASDVNIDWHDAEFVGAGPTFYDSGSTNYLIQEFGCFSHSRAWVDDPAMPHADYAADSGQPTAFAHSSSGSTRRYSWSGQFRGGNFGAVGYAGLFDFEISHVLGVSVQSVTADCDDFCYSNGLISNIRYRPGEVDGYTDTSFQFVVTAGSNVDITAPGDGTMRIDATNSTPSDFGTQLSGLVGGAGYWGALISGATSSANNGCFEVLAAGTNGSGFPYCILDNASVVEETGGATLRILTAKLSDSDPYYTIHPDILQMYGDHTNFTWSEIRAEDCRDTRSIVGAGRVLVDGVIEDSTDGSHSSSHACEFDWASTNCTNVHLHGLSINGAASFSGTFSNVNFVDCVFTQGTNIPTSGTYITHCHFVDNSTKGTSYSGGAWFNAEPGDTPFDYSPSSGNINTASGLLGRPSDWWFSGATAETRGAQRNVATDDWSLTDNVTVTPGAASLTLTGHVPTVTASNHQTFTPGAASLTLTGHTPTVTASNHITVTPGAASLTLTGHAPTVSVTQNTLVRPGSASFTLTGHAPTVTATLVGDPDVVNLYSVPDAGYASSRYTATVDGGAAGVFGVARASPYRTMGWLANESPEMSWFTFGAEGDAEVVITAVTGTITSAVIYPKTLGIVPEFNEAGTTCTFIAPQGKRLYIEFDGDTANPLMVFSSDPPAMALDVVPFSEGVTTSAPTGGILYFPAGVHTIGKGFRCETGSSVVMDGGAWVIGSFDLIGSNNVSITGHGVLSGEFADAEDLGHTEASFANDLTFTMILGTGGYGGTLEGITIVNSPFYNVNGGISYATDVKVISPWWYNCDGLGTVGDSGNAGVGGSRHSVTDCFVYVGDDALLDAGSAGEYAITGCIIVINVAAAFVFSYTTTGGNSTSGYTRVYDTTVVGRGYYSAFRQPPIDTHSMAMLKVWRDETEAHAAYDRTGITLSGVNLEGGGPNPLFSLENLAYPWGTPFDQAGSISGVVMTNITAETVPQFKSRIYGRDFSNTPHNLRFSNITIAGVALTGTNWSTYVQMNAYPYDINLGTEVIVADRSSGDPIIIFDPGVVVDPIETPVIVDPGDDSLNSYCTLDFANLYHAAYGNPAAWLAASVGARSMALIQAAEAMDLRYADRWAGTQYSSTQPLAWPRSGVVDRGGTILNTDTFPEALQRACAVGALMIVQGFDLVSDTLTTADVSSESKSIGPLSKSVTYRGGKPAQTQFPRLDKILQSAGLVISGSSGWGPTFV